jgi:hypothetical protein
MRCLVLHCTIYDMASGRGLVFALYSYGFCYYRKEDCSIRLMDGCYVVRAKV